MLFVLTGLFCLACIAFVLIFKVDWSPYPNYKEGELGRKVEDLCPRD